MTSILYLDQMKRFDKRGKMQGFPFQIELGGDRSLTHSWDCWQMDVVRMSCHFNVCNT